MQVVVRDEGYASGVCIVDIRGRLDANVTDDLTEALNTVLERRREKVLLNFSGVTYLSSSAFRVLLVSLKKVKAHAGSLRLVEMNPYVEEAFRLTGFDTMFEMYPEEQQGLDGWN